MKWRKKNRLNYALSLKCNNDEADRATMSTVIKVSVSMATCEKRDTGTKWLYIYLYDISIDRWSVVSYRWPQDRWLLPPFTCIFPIEGLIFNSVTCTLYLCYCMVSKWKKTHLVACIMCGKCDTLINTVMTLVHYYIYLYYYYACQFFFQLYNYTRFIDDK